MQLESNICLWKKLKRTAKVGNVCTPKVVLEAASALLGISSRDIYASRASWRIGSDNIYQGCLVALPFTAASTAHDNVKV